jgi:hypothetical protein
LLAWLPAQAADIGGWYADQQRAATQAASSPTPDACPQVIARATLDATALGAYHAAWCYLQAEQPDLIAARAWLSRSAESGFLPAHRLLRALQAAEAGLHSPAPHCHDLGEGRQICHGGAPVPPVAAAPKN